MSKIPTAGKRLFCKVANFVVRFSFTGDERCELGDDQRETGVSARRLNSDLREGRLPGWRVRVAFQYIPIHGSFSNLVKCTFQTQERRLSCDLGEGPTTKVELFQPDEKWTEERLWGRN